MSDDQAAELAARAAPRGRLETVQEVLTRPALLRGYVGTMASNTEWRELSELPANASEKAQDWGKELANWIESPDLWESVHTSTEIPGSNNSETENTPFTSDEQASISAELKSIAESIKKTYKLTAQQSSKLDEKFEEAEKASQRMGRKDWGVFFGGAVFSLILADFITPGVAGHKSVYRYVSQAAKRSIKAG